MPGEGGCDTAWPSRVLFAHRFCSRRSVASFVDSALGASKEERVGLKFARLLKVMQGLSVIATSDFGDREQASELGSSPSLFSAFQYLFEQPDTFGELTSLNEDCAARGFDCR